MINCNDVIDNESLSEEVTLLVGQIKAYLREEKVKEDDFIPVICALLSGMNLAACINVVLYDRMAKAIKQ